jgi:DNA-binding transcriptional LysR family regulator
LRAFVTVAEAGGFLTAATQLGISQPAVSFQIAGLESACSIALFGRRPKLALTEAGRDLLVRARLILAHVDAFEDALVEHAGLRRGRLAIGYTAAHIAMPILARFMEAYPLVRLVSVQDDTATLLAKVEDGALDLMLAPLDNTPDGMTATRVGDTQLSIAALKGQLGPAPRKSLSIKDLAEQKIIMRRDPLTQSRYEAACAKAGATPDVRLLVDAHEAVLEAVVHKVGVGIIFSSEVADTRIRCVSVREAGPPVGVYAICHPELQDLPAARAFLDFALRARMRG